MSSIVHQIQYYLVKFEKVFRDNQETSDLIITHCLSFAWTLLNRESIDGMPFDTLDLVIEDFLVIVMKFVRIFSRLDTLASKSNRNVMLEDGCIKLVLGNMEKFMNEPAVQAEICATLANLACHEANAMYIVRNGGCTMIIKAMRRHGDQIDFQIQAFHALASLGKHAKEILDRESFVSIVVKCVTQHEDEVDLVSAAWHALGRVSIVQHKAHLIGMLFASMRRFNKNHKFQITACFALAHVFFNHPSHRESVLKYDGIPLIISAMGRTYEPKDEEQRLDVDVEEGHTPEPILYSRGNNRVQCSKPLLLQLFGSVSLLNLSECVKCRDRIIDLGGIHYIFQASKRVSEQKDLWYIVYYIFSKFTRCGDDKTGANTR
ncbi:hypothetical protein EDD86DRAFT_244094 [Gorgonomyces haynaldii]|nr:hypothetical protein EDD86DRAFT_244094 [Gorgonomyces haynaldii]